MSEQNDAFQQRLEDTHCEQDWPCAMSGLAHELGDAYATLTEQVETLTADNAALLEKAEKLYGWLDDIDTVDDVVKGDDVEYRRWVQILHKKRHEIATTDGYTVSFGDHLGAALLEEMAGLRARVVTLEKQVKRALSTLEGLANRNIRRNQASVYQGAEMALEDIAALRAAQEGGR